jgi:hypothetical protein
MEAMLTTAPLPPPLHVRKHLLAGHMLFRVEVVDPVPALLAGLARTADFDDPNIVVQHLVEAGEAKVKASLPATL